MDVKTPESLTTEQILHRLIVTLQKHPCIHKSVSFDHLSALSSSAELLSNPKEQPLSSSQLNFDPATGYTSNLSEVFPAKPDPTTLFTLETLKTVIDHTLTFQKIPLTKKEAQASNDAKADLKVLSDSVSRVLIAVRTSNPGTSTPEPLSKIDSTDKPEGKPVIEALLDFSDPHVRFTFIRTTINQKLDEVYYSVRNLVGITESRPFHSFIEPLRTVLQTLNKNIYKTELRKPQTSKTQAPVLNEPKPELPSEEKQECQLPVPVKNPSGSQLSQTPTDLKGFDRWAKETTESFETNFVRNLPKPEPVSLPIGPAITDRPLLYQFRPMAHQEPSQYLYSYSSDHRKLRRLLASCFNPKVHDLDLFLNIAIEGFIKQIDDISAVSASDMYKIPYCLPESSPYATKTLYQYFYPES